MIPEKYYNFDELLEYFYPKISYNNMMTIFKWCQAHRNYNDWGAVMRISNEPEETLAPDSPMVKEFIDKAIDKFGTYDWETNPNLPSGGWKTINIIV